MPDRETVITHLQIIHTWAEFARERDLQFFTPKHLEDIAQWSDDAIALLQKKETQKFFVDESGKITPLPVVVRCKDCKWGDWSRNGKGEEMILCYNGNTGIEDGYLHEPDWFCAEWEKRDD